MAGWRSLRRARCWPLRGISPSGTTTCAAHRRRCRTHWPTSPAAARPQIDVDAQQIADGVLIFGAVEPAEYDPPLLGAACRRRSLGWPLIQFVRAAWSFADGRGLAFGGISPAETRSATLSQCSRVASSSKLGLSWSSRKSPLGFGPLWHVRQLAARIGRITSSNCRGSGR